MDKKPLSREQMKFISDRLNRIRQAGWYSKHVPDPAHIRKARAMLHAYETKQRKAHSDKEARLAKAVFEARAELLFATDGKMILKRFSELELLAKSLGMHVKP